MGRASWGGSTDLSGLFAGLVNEDLNQIKSGVNEAVNNAQKQQAADDAEKQAQWTAGKITDEQWLAYLKQRVASTTDPTLREQYQQDLLQNQDSISDAQWETKFQLNQITTSQLLQHYRVRMAGIATDSPAYRTAATRLTQLVQFQRSGGVHYSDQFSTKSGGTGGSGGGGGGSTAGGVTSTGLSDVVAKGLKGGQTPIGYQGGEVYNTQGPDVVGVLFGQPKANSATAVANSAIDGLRGSASALEGFFNFLKANPKATVYTDPYGHVIPVNPDSIRAADNQYLRIKQTTAAVYYAKGDRSSGDIQLKDATTFVSTTMRDHNTADIQPVLDNFLGLVKAQLVIASKTPDPGQRGVIYRNLSQAMDKFVTAQLPQDTVVGQVASKGVQNVRTPDEGVQAAGQHQKVDVTKRNALEDLVDPQIYDQFASLRQAVDIGAHPSMYTDEEVSAAFDQADALGSLGTGASKIKLSDVFGTGGGGSSASFGAGFTGTADSRVQYTGLDVAKQIEAGTLDPSLAVNANGEPIPLFTYQWNGNTNKLSVVDAVVKRDNGVPTIMPSAGMQNGVAQPAQNAVAFVTDIGGQPTKIWTTVNTQAPDAIYVYRFTAAKTVGNQHYAAGDLVPSSVLAQLGKGGIRQNLDGGVIAKAPLPGTKTANIGGQTWYYDGRTNEWSPSIPWSLTADATDPRSVEVSDPVFVQKADGSMSVDTTSDKNQDTTLISMGLNAGQSGFALPFVGISTPEMQNFIDHEVALGRLDPGDYQHVGPDGHSVVQTDLNGMYYDKNLDNLLPAKQDDSLMTDARRAGVSNQTPDPALDKQQRTQAAEIMQWNQTNLPDKNLWNQRQQAQRADPIAALTDQAAAVGKSLGVNIGATAQPLPAPSAPDYGENIRQAALIAASNRLKIQAQPKLAPLPANPIAPLKAVPHQVAPLDMVAPSPVINPLASVQPTKTPAPSKTTIAAPKGSRFAGKQVPL